MNKEETPESGPILVVDDESSMREVLDIMLAERGIEVVTADSGDRAIELLQEGRDFSYPRDDTRHISAL